MVYFMTDWKNHPKQILNWILLILGTMLLATYLYLWWINQFMRYIAIAIILFTAGFVYFTSFWKPVLYLVVTVPLLTHLAVSFIDGSWRHPFIQTVIILTVIFVLLSIYLCYFEEINRIQQNIT